MADACFVTCRHCPWTGKTATFPESMALLEAHECVFVADIDCHGTDTGYGHHGCRCPDCRSAWRESSERRRCGTWRGPGHRRGEQHGWAKLTEAQVSEIKDHLRHGLSHAGLARAFGVAPDTITKIANGRTWKHVA